jgi:hypothetical protein
MLDVIIFVSNNLANGNHTIYSKPIFEPEPYAVTVNCPFLARLGASNVAASRVWWRGDYNTVITRGSSSPEDRAKRRWFRYAGVLWWKMGAYLIFTRFSGT